MYMFFQHMICKFHTPFSASIAGGHQDKVISRRGGLLKAIIRSVTDLNNGLLYFV